MHFLILGSKEYPVGAGQNQDPLPSGGYEAYTQGLAHALIQTGHQVSIITRRFKNQSIRKTGPLAVYRVPWLNGFFLRNPSFNAAAFMSGSSIEYDACIANGVFATLAALLLKRKNQKPVIARPAGIAWVQPQYPAALRRVLKMLETYAFSNADCVVFLSEPEKKAFSEKMGFLPGRHCIIPTGLDAQAFAKKTHKKARPKNPRPSVLYVGRLVAVKGVQVLLEAMKKIDATLRIVGSGPDEKNLKAFVHQHQMKNVEFLGTQKNVASYYQEADMLVIPSFSEGLPIVLLEAWASEIPCIVTDIGLPVQNGKDALVVPAHNPVAIAKAVLTLASNPKKARALAHTGLAKVKKHYSWKKAAEKYVEVAQQLCVES